MGQRSRTFLWLAVLGIAFLVSLRLPVEGQVAVAPAPPAKPQPSDIMAAWYTANGLADEDKEGLVVYAGQETERFAEMLGLTLHVPTMLAMWHRESGFSEIKGDDRKSFGITQTLYRDERRWRKFWKKRGLGFGSLDDPSTQIAFGVAEFSECLRMARGNEFDAVRRYNGSGAAARRHARKVFRTRQVVFKVPPPKP